jgi:hypothetical protein
VLKINDINTNEAGRVALVWIENQARRTDTKTIIGGRVYCTIITFSTPAAVSPFPPREYHSSFSHWGKILRAPGDCG